MGAKKRTMSSVGLVKMRAGHLLKWLNEASRKNDNRFDYEKVPALFQTQKGPAVEVVCRVHQKSFFVTPFNHLRSKNGGCKNCDQLDSVSYFRKREWEKFYPWFEKNRAHDLEIKSDFNGMTQNVIFFCKKHYIETSCKPTILMNEDSYGCVKCASEAAGLSSRLSISDVQASMAADMPDHVEILDVIFDHQHKASRIRIRCANHGEQTLPKATLDRSPHKCPKCGRENMGYASNRLSRLVARDAPGRAAVLGVMSIEVFSINALKVGVTTRTLQDRYKWYLKKIHYEVQMPERDVYILENQIHRHFRSKHDLRILMAGMRLGERWAGDTECYFEDQKQQIEDFIQNFLNIKKIEYDDELRMYEIPKFFDRDVSRPKNLSNRRAPIVAVDPISKVTKYEFQCIADAVRAGFFNVSTASRSNGQMLVGGFQWFRKSDFNPDTIPSKRRKAYKTRPVKCIESGQLFLGAAFAARELKNSGIKISAAHITSVCSGQRKTAGGYHWEYSLDFEG